MNAPINAVVNSAAYFFRHPVARRRPGRTLLRFLRWQIVSRTRLEVETSWIGGTRLIARRGMTGLSGSLYYGLHEFHEMALVLHLLRPGDLFVDAGANAGAYTVLAAGVAGADVAAFEPGAPAAAALDRNIAANGLGDRVTVHRAALGAAAGTASFIDDAGTMNRLSPDGTQTVTVTTLDKWAPDPVVVKLDIEGGELAALQGASALLQRQSLLAIITESHEPEITHLLTAAGFEKFSYDAVTRAFSPMAEGEGNAVFIRDMAHVQARIATAGTVSVCGYLI